MSQNVCRTCLGRGKYINIFYGKGTFNIAAKFKSVTKIQIHPNDDLPQVICKKCLRKLKSCWNFIELCVLNDSKLRAVSNQNISDEDTRCTTIEHQSDLPLKIEISEVLSNKNLDIPQEIYNASTGQEKLQDKASNKKQQCFTCGKVMSSKHPDLLRGLNEPSDGRVYEGMLLKGLVHQGKSHSHLMQCCRSNSVSLHYTKFLDRFRLKTHLLTHTGEKPYSCTHCNKTFSLAQSLKVHIRTHTGEKPLKCVVCGARFAQSAGLAAHRRKHNGEKPYQCTLCPRNFRTIGHLQYHTRGHTGEKKFECDTCTKSFITRSDLKRHLLSHSKLRLHVCNACGVRVSRASHLKRHMRHAHNSKKQFHCAQCNATFTNECEYHKHEKNHVIINEESSKETEIAVH